MKKYRIITTNVYEVIAENEINAEKEFDRHCVEGYEHNLLVQSDITSVEYESEVN